jgi:hypothetical protein
MPRGIRVLEEYNSQDFIPVNGQNQEFVIQTLFCVFRGLRLCLNTWAAFCLGGWVEIAGFSCFYQNLQDKEQRHGWNPDILSCAEPLWGEVSNVHNIPLQVLVKTGKASRMAPKGTLCIMEGESTRVGEGLSWPHSTHGADGGTSLLFSFVLAPRAWLWFQRIQGE